MKRFGSAGGEYRIALDNAFIDKLGVLLSDKYPEPADLRGSVAALINWVIPGFLAKVDNGGLGITVDDGGGRRLLEEISTVTDRVIFTTKVLRTGKPNDGRRFTDLAIEFSTNPDGYHKARVGVLRFTVSFGTEFTTVSYFNFTQITRNQLIDYLDSGFAGDKNSVKDSNQVEIEKSDHAQQLVRFACEAFGDDADGPYVSIPDITEMTPGDLYDTNYSAVVFHGYDVGDLNTK